MQLLKCSLFSLVCSILTYFITGATICFQSVFTCQNLLVSSRCDLISCSFSPPPPLSICPSLFLHLRPLSCPHFSLLLCVAITPFYLSTPPAISPKCTAFATWITRPQERERASTLNYELFHEHGVQPELDSHQNIPKNPPVFPTIPLLFQLLPKEKPLDSQKREI